MIDIDKIEEAAKRHGNDADWQGAAIAYETHVTPSVVLEMVSLIRLQEAGLNAEQARYESLSEAFASIPAQTGMQSLEWDAVNSAANTANNNFGQWMPERWLQEFVKAYNASIPAQPVQQPAPVANIALPGCLADRLYEAISIAHDRAQHAGSTQRMKKWDATRADLRAALAAPVAAPVAGQEPFGHFMSVTHHDQSVSTFAVRAGLEDSFPLFAAPVPAYSIDKVSFHNDGSEPDWAEHAAAEARDAVPAASVQPATVTLDGHQLRMALEFINPDGLDDRDQMDNDLTFGVRQHQGDDGTISTGMCCWNDDSDGVLPLDGEYPDLAKDNCPTCGNSWAEHEFAVPAPYCPEPRKATTNQPDSAPVVDMEDITYLTAHIKRAKEIVGCPEDDNLIEFLSLAQRAANVAQPVAADEEAEFKAWAGVAHRNAASYSVRDYQLGLSAWNARAALAAPVAAPVTGQEPTKAMLAAGWECMPKEGEARSSMDYVYYIYMAMQRAAPVPAASMQTDSAEYQRGFAAGRLDAHRLHKSVTFKAMAQRDEVMSGAPPNSVQPNDDWTMDDVDLAGKIMLLLGRAASCSREPGADSLRDRIALMLNKHSAANVAQVGELSDEQINEIVSKIRETNSCYADESSLCIDSEGVQNLVFAILAAAKKGA